MKTLKELNQKMWYRAIQVVYLSIAFILSIFVLFLSYIALYDIQKVQQDISTKQENIKTKDTFKEHLSILQQDNNLDIDIAYKETLNFYKNNWWTIEWVDIDAELRALWITTWSQLIEVTWETSLIFYRKLLIMFYLVCITLGLYILFLQVIPRAMYYIIFWTLFPKKD